MKNKKKVILNLQEHGNRMLKSIGLSLLASIAFYFLHAPLLFFLFGLVTAILSITLFLLVVRENKLKSAKDSKVSKTDRTKK
jgi:uncharacterized MnhB-related membrane protein